MSTIIYFGGGQDASVTVQEDPITVQGKFNADGGLPVQLTRRDRPVFVNPSQVAFWCEYGK